MDSLAPCVVDCVANLTSCSLADLDCLCTGPRQPDEPLSLCIIQACSSQETLAARKIYDTECGYPTSEKDRGAVFLIIILIVFSITAVSLRIAGRLIGSKIGPDDITIVISVVLATVGSIIGVVGSNIGLGMDIWMIPFDQLTRSFHLEFIVETLYFIVIPLSKVSILLLYLRLFPDPRFRCTTYIALVFTSLWGIAFFIVKLLSCQPLSYFWHAWDSQYQGTCMDAVEIGCTHMALNIFFDLVIIGLPLPTLVKLTLSWWRKLGILLMFAVGFVVTAICILRLVMTFRLVITGNATKEFVITVELCFVEMNLSIICACMPGIKAFFSYTWARFTRQRLASHSSPPDSNSASRRLDQSKSLQSANREIGEFIRLQEIDSPQP